MKLLEANEQQLADRAVWFFSSGPMGEGDPSVLMKGYRFPEAQQPSADRIKPRDIAFFHANICFSLSRSVSSARLCAVMSRQT